VLDFIDIKHKTEIHISNIRNEHLRTAENKPNHLYCSVNSMTNTRTRDNTVLLLITVNILAMATNGAL